MPNHFWRTEVIQPALNHDVETAVAEQLAILKTDPNNAQAYFALGTLSHFKGQVEQAVRHFEKSIELDPTCPAPHVSLGRIYAVSGDYGAAWKHARAAEALGARDLVELLARFPNLK
jgi:Flp pilus assembly protein TadD